MQGAWRLDKSALTITMFSLSDDHPGQLGERPHTKSAHKCTMLIYNVIHNMYMCMTWSVCPFWKSEYWFIAFREFHCTHLPLISITDTWCITHSEYWEKRSLKQHCNWSCWSVSPSLLTNFCKPSKSLLSSPADTWTSHLDIHVHACVQSIL